MFFSPSTSRPELSSGRPGFSSKKCLPMPYPRRCCRDFLVLASLDPATGRIDPAQHALSGAPNDCFFAATLIRSGTSTLVMLCDRSQGPLILSDGSQALALSRPALNSPAIMTARLIWSRRRAQVHPAFVLQLIQLLGRAARPRAFGDLLDIDGYSDPDKIDWAMALACRGIVDIHIDGELTPKTLISLPTKPGHWPPKQAQSPTISI